MRDRLKMIFRLRLLISLTLILDSSGQNYEEQFNRCSEDLYQLEQEVVILKSRSLAPSSCEELMEMGKTNPGSYAVDFDGSDAGSPAIEVYCQFNEGQTRIGGYKTQDVDHCPGAGCFTMDSGYNNHMLMQMKSLVEQSEQCHQNITFDCVRARINVSLTFLDKN